MWREFILVPLATNGFDWSPILPIVTTALGGLGTLFSGKVFVPTYIYNRERDAADACRKENKEQQEKYETEIRRLNTLLQTSIEKVVPALEAGTAVQVKSQEALSAANQIIRDLTHQLGAARGSAQ